MYWWKCITMDLKSIKLQFAGERKYKVREYRGWGNQEYGGKCLLWGENWGAIALGAITGDPGAAGHKDLLLINLALWFYPTKYQLR